MGAITIRRAAAAAGFLLSLLVPALHAQIIVRGVLYDDGNGTPVRGTVMLIEFPTDDEIHDNIVAFWVPKEPAEAGDQLVFSYRLHWTGEEPFMPPLARVVATRRGRGGIPGVADRRPFDGRIKYVVDFEGGDIAKYRSGDPVEPVVSVSRGKVIEPYAIRVNTTDRWRIVFDLKAEGSAPVEMRAYLRKKEGEALTETWLCQHPPGLP